MVSGLGYIYIMLAKVQSCALLENVGGSDGMNSRKKVQSRFTDTCRPIAPVNLKLVRSIVYSKHTTFILFSHLPIRDLNFCSLLRRRSGASRGWEPHEDLETVIDTPFWSYR